eukprot:6375316-Amphidinium_carterae.1
MGAVEHGLHRTIIEIAAQSHVRCAPRKSVPFIPKTAVLSALIIQSMRNMSRPVSYTHLTLPTILLV